MVEIWGGIKGDGSEFYAESKEHHGMNLSFLQG